MAWVGFSAIGHPKAAVSSCLKFIVGISGVSFPGDSTISSQDRGNEWKTDSRPRRCRRLTFFGDVVSSAPKVHQPPDRFDPDRSDANSPLNSGQLLSCVRAEVC